MRSPPTAESLRPDPASPAAPQTTDTVERWLCRAAIAFGIYLRVFHFWKPSLWLDEISTAYIASSPNLATLWQRCRLAYEFPVHHLLTRFCLLFGHSEFFIRLPSVLLGAASVFLFFALLRRFTEMPGPLYASAILALNSFAILYSQDGRMYALAVFLTLASVYSFLRLVEGAGREWLAAYAIVTILLSYNQVLYIAVFAGQILVAVLLCWRAPAEGRLRLRPLLMLQAAVLPLLIPLFLRLRLLGSSHADLSSWIEKPDWPWIRYVLAWPEVYFASVLLPGAWVLWKNRQRLRPRSDAQRALLWLGLLYTAIWPVALAFACFGVVNLMVPRYLLPALLGVLFLTAFCASKVGGVLLRSTLGAYIVLLIYFHATAIGGFGTWLEIIYKPSWRAASTWVDTHYRSGDVVLVRSGLNQSRMWPPQEPGAQQFLTAALTGFYARRPIAAWSLPYSDLDLPRSPYAAVARQASRHATRVLVVLDPMPEGWRWEPLEEWLRETDPLFSEADRRSFNRLELRVYSKQNR